MADRFVRLFVRVMDGLHDRLVETARDAGARGVVSVLEGGYDLR